MRMNPPCLQAATKNENEIKEGLQTSYNTSNQLNVYIFFFNILLLLVYIATEKTRFNPNKIAPVPLHLILLCSSTQFLSKIQLREDLDKTVINVLVILYSPPLPIHQGPNNNPKAKNKSKFFAYVVLPICPNPRSRMSFFKCWRQRSWLIIFAFYIQREAT